MKLVLTPKQKEKITNSNKKELEETSLSYTIGYLITEKVTGNLPNLETDQILSSNIYKVSKEEKEKHEYYKKNDQWSNLLKYRRFLAGKYLPLEFTLRTPAVPFDDEKEFKKGISHAIWACDHSWYSSKTKKIEISYNKYYTYLEIKLKLDIEE